MRGTLHHLVLTVTDPDRSFDLYNTVLCALGYRLEYSNPDGFEWALQVGDSTHSIGILKARSGDERSHDRYRPGLHHLALRVDSREAVDRMHELLQQAGATILAPPAEYPQYNKGRGYYAVFFADRDGLKLECVFTPVDRDHSQQ